MPGKPVPLRQRSYAIQPGVAWFSALPGGRAGGVPQPQRGCAEGPNVWVTLFRMGCDIENPSSRCPFRLIRARAGNLPACCPGTTPLGLFILWEWTQGSASAAQPWALGQNPVGIPGGGRLVAHHRRLRLGRLVHAGRRNTNPCWGSRRRISMRRHHKLPGVCGAGVWPDRAEWTMPSWVFNNAAPGCPGCGDKKSVRTALRRFGRDDF